MGFLDWLSGTTPGGAVGEAGSKVIGGLFSGVKDLISEFHLSPEQEQQMRLKLAELELQSYQARISDVQSARAMQMATRSVWPGVLTMIIIFGYFGLLIAMIIHEFPSTTKPGGEVLLTLIGVLAGAVPSVLQYWFGSSQGNRAKDELLANSVPSSMVKSENK